MTKEAYGIPVPRGVRKDWRTMAMLAGLAHRFLLARSVPEDWGEPSRYAVWQDRFGRKRLVVAHYANGRSATVRIDANGVSRTIFGEVGNG